MLGLITETGQKRTSRFDLTTQFQKVLLLATKFTMEDGFFAKILEEKGIEVVIPEAKEREQMKIIHAELMLNQIHECSRDFFHQLMARYQDVDAIILGCTEYSLLVNENTFPKPIIDPVYLQTLHAVNYALSE